MARAKISAKVTGKRRLNLALNARGQKMDAALKRTRAKSALKVVGEAQKLIQGGQKTGAVYGNHRASAPGESPASDTGNLAQQIMVDSRGDEVFVISRAPYSAALEFGTRHMEPRPYFRRAYNNVRPEILKDTARELRKI